MGEVNRLDGHRTTSARRRQILRHVQRRLAALEDGLAGRPTADVWAELVRIGHRLVELLAQHRVADQGASPVGRRPVSEHAYARAWRVCGAAGAGRELPAAGDLGPLWDDLAVRLEEVVVELERFHNSLLDGGAVVVDGP